MTDNLDAMTIELRDRFRIHYGRHFAVMHTKSGKTHLLCVGELRYTIERVAKEHGVSFRTVVEIN